MLNFNLEPMEETKQTGTSEVQQTQASKYCELRHLNSDILLDCLTEDINVEKVAMLIDKNYRFGDQMIRWGMVYRACMDSGVFAPIGITKFWEMSRNLIPGLPVQRPTFSKGVYDFDVKVRDHRKGEQINSDDLTYVKAYEPLVDKLKGLVAKH